ncbi:MAG TPA: hypothetical protein DDW43_06935 [Nitrosomonas sp.]|uniref:Uncharacterized protein n=1 Tax=Nitrosomonas europaea (strain ATCC 19718 / CIP 103999 / KCTC 2705 / NBRC 14298) TaxID=228410 RepID=Q82UB8_NITEU|nr:hypothetical protein NE1576 [Nitrosomonas europaea ATCC 19718]HBF25214.1 hypothetical protein [Nitrosomonas sp.]
MLHARSVRKDIQPVIARHIGDPEWITGQIEVKESVRINACYTRYRHQRFPNLQLNFSTDHKTLLPENPEPSRFNKRAIPWFTSRTT